MDKPDYVTNFQLPEGTTLKKIGNRWYLYGKPSYVVDPETGKKKTVAGAYLGKVGPNGLEPPKRRAGTRTDKAADERAMVSKVGKGARAQNSDKGVDSMPKRAIGQKSRYVKSDLLSWYRWDWDDVEDEKDKLYRSEFEWLPLEDEPSWLEAGPCVLVWSRTKALRQALRKHFPDNWKQIFQFAFMRLVYGSDFVRQKEDYRLSLLPAMFPGLQRDIPYLKYRNVLIELGQMRKKIVGFMREEMAFPKKTDNDEEDFNLDSHSRLKSVRWLVCESSAPSIIYEDPDYDAEEYVSHPEYNYDFDPREGKSKQWVFPRVLYVFEMAFPSCPRFYQARTLLPLGLDDMEAFLEESGLSPNDCLFFLDESSLAGVEAATLEKKALRVVRFLSPGTFFDKKHFPSLKNNDEVFTALPLYPHQRQRIVAIREKFEDGWRMSSLFDIDWYRASVNEALSIEEYNQGWRRRQLERELERRTRGEGQWTDAELKKVQDELSSSGRKKIGKLTDIGIMEVSSNLLDWSKRDLYWVCLRFAQANGLMIQLATRMKEHAWGVSDSCSEEGWFFVDYVSLLMQWAVVPKNLRPHLEALDISVGGAFFDLRHYLRIRTRTGRLDPEYSREYEKTMLSRVLGFSMRDVDIIQFLAACRAEH